MTYLILFLFLTGTCLYASGYASLYRDRLGRTGTFVVKALVSLIAFCGVLTLGAFALLNELEIGSGMCSTEIASQFSSPNGENVATIFTVDCGAVTSFDEIVPHVMLRDRLHPVVLNEKNQIILRRDWLGRRLDDTVYVGEMNDIRWLSDNHLEIQPMAGEPGDTAWQNVTISYKQPKRKGKVQ